MGWPHPGCRRWLPPNRAYRPPQSRGAVAVGLRPRIGEPGGDCRFALTRCHRRQALDHREPLLVLTRRPKSAPRVEAPEVLVVVRVVLADQVPPPGEKVLEVRGVAGEAAAHRLVVGQLGTVSYTHLRAHETV